MYFPRCDKCGTRDNLFIAMNRKKHLPRHLRCGHCLVKDDTKNFKGAQWENWNSSHDRAYYKKKSNN